MEKESTKARPDLVPKRKHQQQAVPLLQIVQEVFKDPKTAKKFKDWQKARETKKRSTGT